MERSHKQVPKMITCQFSFHLIISEVHITPTASDTVDDVVFPSLEECVHQDDRERTRAQWVDNNVLLSSETVRAIAEG